MSGKGGKGKGKTRGGGVAAQRSSRSRNTTPASNSAYSENTYPTTDSKAYDEILDKYVNASTDIPSSSSLIALRAFLHERETMVRARSVKSDLKIREISLKCEERRGGDKERLLQVGLDQKRSVDDDEKRDRKPELDKVKADRKKKDHKRPPAVGAHQATTQAPPDVVVKGEPFNRMKKRKMESPVDEKSDKRNSSSPAKSRSSDSDIQPPAVPPHMVFEHLDDDPTVYEIPDDIPPETSYEDRAKIFSVSRFPTSDLADLGPGDPPDEEIKQNKPPNQVAMNTFNTYIEPYFRPYNEEDLGFLRERGERVVPYMMPTLGRHYTEVWGEEDSPNYTSPLPSTSGSSRNPNVPKGNSDNLTDENLEKDEVSCGPLLSRIMAALIPEDSGQDSPNNDGNDPDSTPQPSAAATTMPESSQPSWKVATGRSDYMALENRLKQEMRYIGLIGPNTEIDWKAREDDEVSARLRTLQAQLKEQSVINGARKARIAELLKEQLAHQEYATILDDLDKQVTDHYKFSFPPAPPKDSESEDDEDASSSESDYYVPPSRLRMGGKGPGRGAAASTKRKSVTDGNNKQKRRQLNSRKWTPDPEADDSDWEQPPQGKPTRAKSIDIKPGGRITRSSAKNDPSFEPIMLVKDKGKREDSPVRRITRSSSRNDTAFEPIMLGKRRRGAQTVIRQPTYQNSIKLNPAVPPPTRRRPINPQNTATATNNITTATTGANHEDGGGQVEQAYSKRTRNMKATKKKKVVPNGVGVAQARVGIGEAARTLMERRKRWMTTIGPVFDEGVTKMPTETIFSGLEDLMEKEKVGAQEEE
ncbi:Transcriptional regulator [Rhizina undulata]